MTPEQAAELIEIGQSLKSLALAGGLTLVVIMAGQIIYVWSRK